MLISNPPPGEAAIVLLYDPSSGRIVHGLHFEVDPGGKLPDQAALETSAREAAALHAREADKALLPKLAVLHADPKTFDLRGSYTVDPKTRRLVTHPA